MGMSKFTQEIKSEIADKYKKGVDVTLLCQEYGISRSYLYRIVKLKKKHRNPYQKTAYTLWDIELMKRELASLKTENEIFRKSGCGLNSSNDEKIAAVDKLKNEYSIHIICKTLGLLKSTYYHRVKRAPEKKWYEIRNEMLCPKILAIFKESKEWFGAQKVLIKLKQQGLQVSIDAVSKMMKEMGLVCKQSRMKKYNTTNKCSKYRKNRLKRNLNPNLPNTFWVSDITYMLTSDGDCYICVIMDLFSRKIIAYSVDCLVSTDNENFTYNKHVNRLSNVQEQKMIEKAINRGVSIERLARVLNMNPENIRHKKNLLKGICEEVVEMLKDKIVSSKVFYYLARMKPERQIEATKIMVESKTFTSSFARSIWLATSDEQLAVPRRQQRPAVTDFSHFTKLEEEINRLHGEYEEIEENYGLNVLNFTLVKGYVKTLVMNPRVNRYLRINNPDILEHLESIVDIDNLNTEE